MNLIAIALDVANLSQPLSDRRDYGSTDKFQIDRANEWHNTEDGNQLLNATYQLQDLAEGIKSDDDLGELISILKTIPAKVQSIIDFIES